MRSKKYLLFIAALSVNSLMAQAQVINTFAGTGVVGNTGDGGLALAATFGRSTGVAFDGSGNVYIADHDNNVVRKVNTLGIITTIAGNGTAGYSGDGGAATAAKLQGPTHVVADAAGNIYITDNGNNAVRKIDATGRITTYAGNGTAGYTGDADSANAAQLNAPQGLALDDAGTLYIADAGNHVVRMVVPDRLITTIAGTGMAGNSGDGGHADMATLSTPSSVAVDMAHNVYVADYFNNVVRKIDGSTLMISRVAGNGTPGSGGDGGAAVAAQLKYPASISVDGAGNMYIADQGNNNIRRVSATGIISRFAGSGASGYLGDGGAASAAQLSSPVSVAADGWGRVYVSDYGNNVVRVVKMPTGINTPVQDAGALSVFPNPSVGMFTVHVPAGISGGSITVMDVTGKVIATNAAQAGAQAIDLGSAAAGTYTVQLTSGGKVYSSKVSITK